MLGLGDGFTTINGERRSRALVTDPSKIILPGGNPDGFDSLRPGVIEQIALSPTYYRTHIAGTTTELTKIFKSSLNLSTTLGTLAPSIEAAYSREVKADTTNIYYVLEIVNGEYSRRIRNDPEFTPAAKDRLQLPPPIAAGVAGPVAAPATTQEDIEEFYKKYGNKYISQISYGRRIVALITVSVSTKSKKSSLTFGGGLSGASLAELRAKFERDVTQLKTESIMDVAIETDGIAGAMVGYGQSLRELVDAMAKFYTPANHLKDPAPIHYEFEDYDEIMKSYHIPDAIPAVAADPAANPPVLAQPATPLIQHLREAVTRTTTLQDAIFGRRNHAKMLLNTNAFQEHILSYARIVESLVPIERPELVNDVHHRRLDYLYAKLDQIYREYLGGEITQLRNNIFRDAVTTAPILALNLAEQRNSGGELVRPGGIISEYLKNIQDELRGLAGRALLKVISCPVDRTRWIHEIESDVFTLRIPDRVHNLYFAAYAGPQVTADRPYAVEPLDTAVVTIAAQNPYVTHGISLPPTLVGDADFHITLQGKRLVYHDVCDITPMNQYALVDKDFVKYHAHGDRFKFKSRYHAPNPIPAPIPAGIGAGPPPINQYTLKVYAAVPEVDIGLYFSDRTIVREEISRPTFLRKLDAIGHTIAPSAIAAIPRPLPAATPAAVGPFALLHRRRGETLEQYLDKAV
ncbi:MAG: hypothetical protein Q7V63_05625 [Gammaproteobacteria bacterium]|nr:hypothetical protein [Gammaproteobacteria bacterium]